MASRAELLGGILQWYIGGSRATSSMSNSNSHQLSRGVIKVIPRTSQCSKLIYPWKAKDKNKPISLHPWKLLLTGGFGLRARWAVSESPLNDIYLFSLKPRALDPTLCRKEQWASQNSYRQNLSFTPTVQHVQLMETSATCLVRLLLAFLHSNSDSAWNSSCNIHTISIHFSVSNVWFPIPWICSQRRVRLQLFISGRPAHLYSKFWPGKSHWWCHSIETSWSVLKWLVFLQRVETTKQMYLKPPSEKLGMFYALRFSTFIVFVCFCYLLLKYLPWHPKVTDHFKYIYIIL